MDQIEFLEKNIFTDLKNLNDGFDEENNLYFSQSDFEVVLQRVEHYGIGVYEIKSWLNGEFLPAVTHGDFNKKATDPRWYKRALLTLKSKQPDLLYSATYKVSNKLLARQTGSGESVQSDA